MLHLPIHLDHAKAVTYLELLVVGLDILHKLLLLTVTLRIASTRIVLLPVAPLSYICSVPSLLRRAVACICSGLGRTCPNGLMGLGCVASLSLYVFVDVLYVAHHQGLLIHWSLHVVDLLLHVHVFGNILRLQLIVHGCGLPLVLLWMQSALCIHNNAMVLHHVALHALALRDLVRSGLVGDAWGGSVLLRGEALVGLSEANRVVLLQYLVLGSIVSDK